MKNTKILKSISFLLLFVFSITLSLDVVFATKKEETSINIQIHDGNSQKQIGDNIETIIIETDQSNDPMVVKAEKEMRRINGIREVFKHPFKLAFSTAGGFLAGLFLSACTLFTVPVWLTTISGAVMGLLGSGISSYCKGYNL